jgi:hypothetical protein
VKGNGRKCCARYRHAFRLKPNLARWPKSASARGCLKTGSRCPDPWTELVVAWKAIREQDESPHDMADTDGKPIGTLAAKGNVSAPIGRSRR